MNNKLYRLLLLIFVPFQLFAQDIIKVSSKNGLPHNIVYSIKQDRNGFVWLATEDGLCKYDGYTFSSYRPNKSNPNSLLDNLTKCSFTDKAGDLWIGTHSGISRFNPMIDGFEHYTLKVKSKTDRTDLEINSIVDADQNKLFVGTTDGHILLMDKASKATEELFVYDSGSRIFKLYAISTLYYDRTGILWIGTYNQGLLKYDLKRKQLEHFTTENGLSTHNYILSITEDSEKNIWFGTQSGLCIYLYKTKKVEKLSLHNNLPEEIRKGVIYSLLIDRNKNLWIGTQQDGLFKINAKDLSPNPNEKKMTHYTAGNQYNSLPVRTVNSIFEDKDMNIWIGTWSGGACVIPAKQKLFNNLLEHDLQETNFTNRKIWGVCEDKNGNLWLGSDGGGLYKWNRSSNKLSHYIHQASNKNSISDNAILRAYCDSQGEMWFGTFRGGLVHYRKAQDDFEHFNIDGKNEVNDIRTIFEDSRHNLWLGTNGNGLYLFDRKANKLTKTSFLNGNDFRSIAEHDGIWVGSYQGILFHFNLDTHKVESWPTQKNNTNALSGNSYLDILPDSARHKLWLASKYGGLSEFDLKTKSITTYKESDGLANNTVLALAMDRKHNIWLSTNSGISKFEPNSKRFFNFTSEIGVLNGEFNDGSKAYLSDGSICFGGITGLNVFHPDSIELNSTSSKPTVLDIKVFNESIKKTILDNNEVADIKNGIPSKIKLKYNENFITIDFAAINFLEPQSIHYAYILEGLEKKWNYVGARRSAYYSNLQAGKYIFKVKSSLYENRWSQPIEIEIIIRPPFWKTWWAYLLYFVLCVSLSALVLSYYKRKILLEHELQLSLENQELQKTVFQDKIVFYNNISHELRTPLTLILAPLEELLAVKEVEGSVRQQLRLIYSSAQKLLGFVNRLLAFSKAEEGSMKLSIAYHDVCGHIASVIQSFSSIARKSEVHVDFMDEGKSLMLWYDKDKFEIIIYNLLSNAFKFTPKGGRVDVSVLESNDQIIIKVSDTGRGISEENLKNLFSRFHQIGLMKSVSGTGIGLALTHSLILLHKATIDVQSEIDKGTCFTITFTNKPEIYSKAELGTTNSGFSAELSILNDDAETDIQPVDTNVKIEQENASLHSLLIVEDNHEMQDYLRTSFSSLYRISAANDGQEALQMIADGFFPDLIISDVMMPVMDGISFAREIKSQASTSHIPIILLTAKTGLNEKLEGLSTGAIDYISKPFNLEVLKTKVHNLIAETDIIKDYFKKKYFLEPSVVSTISNEELILSKAKQIIEDHLHDPEFNVNTLVEKMSMSHSALYNKIKLYTELNLNEFIRHFRIRRAAQLMLTTDFGVAEIAYQTGFNDLKYFRECFKKEYGMTPTEYKKNG